MGEAGSDLLSDLDYGNIYPTRCLGHCVGLPALSLLSLMGSSLFSSPEFRYRTVGTKRPEKRLLLFSVINDEIFPRK